MVRFISPKPLAQVFKNQSVEYEKLTPSLINGKRTVGKGASWEIIYPATEELLGKCSSASKEQVESAVSSAKEAFESGIWRDKPLSHRQAIFYKISELF